METKPKSTASADGEEELVPADDAIIGKAFRWSLLVFVGIGAGIGGIMYALYEPPKPAALQEMAYVKPETIDRSAAAPLVEFVDMTKTAGIDFIHENGATGDKLLPETMGAGAAFFDFDDDGDADLLLVNGAPWPWDSTAGDAPRPTQALYRNDGGGRFENVTPGSGLDVCFYGQGVAIGDCDGDGRPDVLITAVGKNRLFRNLGDGRFEDVTAAAGVGGDETEWSTSAAFFDADNDGDLDLFVCNYVRWSREIDFEVDYRFAGIGRAYGPPMNFEGAYSYLYRNNGDGTFTDVSEAAGVQVKTAALGKPMGKALGVVPIDVDEDGWCDLIVANDTVANFFFHNKGDGAFEERGAEFGLAFDRNGNSTGAMGIDAGMYREDGALGVFIGNFANEMTSAYVSQGNRSLFADEAISEGIGAPTRLMLSFGVLLFDYDLDGRLDLFQTNGHIEDEINLIQPSQHYEQPSQLFWNMGSGPRGCFATVEPATTGDLSKPLAGRGATFADIDNDGDLDVLITQTGRPPVLLRNEQALGHHALRVRLRETAGNRDALGAWVFAKTAAGTQARPVMPARSYLSSVELPVTIGVGEATSAEISVRWPDGAREDLGPLKAGATYTITKGGGVTHTAPLR